MSMEVPEHAALDDVLEFEPVDLLKLGGLMEAAGSVRLRGEDAVEDDESGKGSGLTAAPLP